MKSLRDGTPGMGPDIATAAGRLRYRSGSGPIGAALQAVGAAATMEHMDVVGTYVSDSGLQVIASYDRTQHGELLHVSISRRDRYPTWGEIKAVREAFFEADEDVMMLLPKRAHYVNVHPNCFHLWQTPTAWNVM